MSAEKGRKFDLKGNKYAYIFSFDTTPTSSSVDDTNVVYRTLNDLGFQIISDTSLSTDNDELDDDAEMPSEDESDDAFDNVETHPTDEQPVRETILPPKYKNFVIRNPKSNELVEFVGNIAKSKADASCILLYIIASQDGYKMLNAEKKDLPLFSLWKQLKGIQCPKLFILQANVTENAKVHSVLLNSEKNEEANQHFTLPESANMLLAYLPNCRNGEMSVANILTEELHKPVDINTVMTTVIGRLKSMDCRPSPKFSSTLIGQLCLIDGLDNSRSQELPKPIHRRQRCLAYAFPFGKFDNEEMDDLTCLMEADGKHLCETFKGMGIDLEICVKKGQMKLDEFYKKLTEIVQDKKKLAWCDCIMITMSSHGNKCGILHAYDGCFSVDFVWRALSKCNELKGKPIVLVIDACRGDEGESPTLYKNSLMSKGCSEEGRAIPEDLNLDDEDCDMSDVLVVLASTEGMQSYGNTGGSLLIRNLCTMLKKHGRENFLEILNLTMHEVAHIYIEQEDPNSHKWIPVKQQVTFTSSLQELLYLPEYQPMKKL